MKRFWPFGLLVLMIPASQAVVQWIAYEHLGHRWWNLAALGVCVASALFIIGLLVQSLREGI